MRTSRAGSSCCQEATGLSGVPDGLVLVPLTRLSRFSPLDRPFWTPKAVTTDQVLIAVAMGRLRSAPVLELTPDWDQEERHAERIAWYVVHGLSATDFLEIDVGVPALGQRNGEPVVDGNHRLAASLIRGESSVACSISGQAAEVRRLFGRKVEEAVFSSAMRSETEEAASTLSGFTPI